MRWYAQFLINARGNAMEQARTDVEAKEIITKPTGAYRLRSPIGLRRSVGAFFPLFFFAILQANAHPDFRDPLDSPAQVRVSPADRPLLAVARVGETLVAVGSRGLIIVSSDGGRTWTQASVPVQSDLVALYFPTASQGWAVGHDGVVLNSADGGRSWTKRLDGRDAEKIFREYYRDGAASGDPVMQGALNLTEVNFRAGPALPFLDVWFEDTQKGFVVGSFGMIAATSDAGQTWQPWLHRIANDEALNLNSIRGIGSEVYIAGERGVIFRLDRVKGRFMPIDTGYGGSFFGIAGNGQVILAFGLRGVVYRSDDGGASWASLKMPFDSTITAGIYVSASRAFVLVNDAGQILVSDAAGRDFSTVRADRLSHLTGVAEAGRRSLAVSGLGGIRSQSLSAELN